MNVVNYKRAKVYGKLVVGIGKRVATNENGFEIVFEMKNFKARSSEIEVMVHAKKIACP
jgi:collagenase-like PrtC family protease